MSCIKQIKKADAKNEKRRSYKVFFANCHFISFILFFFLLGFFLKTREMIIVRVCVCCNNAARILVCMGEGQKETLGEEEPTFFPVFFLANSRQ